MSDFLEISGADVGSLGDILGAELASPPDDVLAALDAEIEYRSWVRDNEERDQAAQIDILLDARAVCIDTGDGIDKEFVAERIERLGGFFELFIDRSAFNTAVHPHATTSAYLNEAQALWAWVWERIESEEAAAALAAKGEGVVLAS